MSSIKIKVLKFLPEKLRTSLMSRRGYYKKFGEYPNLKSPITFGEKIQWIKINGKLNKYGELVCKYKVREYVTNKIGDKYLIKLLGVYDNVDEINFEELPKKFVLKASHGSGYNIIVKDKSKIDIQKTKETLNLWLSKNYYDTSFEAQYKNINPKIICEEYMEDDSGELRDYKIFCFDSKPMYIQVHSERSKKQKVDLYDCNWKKTNIKTNLDENSEEILQKPKNLDEMLILAKKLSKGIPFVRVDFYIADNNIYFGELTFTPANGFIKYEPKIEDLKMASMIDLAKYR